MGKSVKKSSRWDDDDDYEIENVKSKDWKKIEAQRSKIRHEKYDIDEDQPVKK